MCIPIRDAQRLHDGCGTFDLWPLINFQDAGLCFNHASLSLVNRILKIRDSNERTRQNFFSSIGWLCIARIGPDRKSIRPDNYRHSCACCRFPSPSLFCSGASLSLFGGTHGTFGGNAICWTCDSGGLGRRSYALSGKQGGVCEANREIAVVCARRS
jgi:hypothetical protein